MKLNIGCGYNRLEGYINIDSNPDAPADMIMSAHDLDFAAGSVDEIKALQLVEHLGFFKAKYFLSECRRALVPGGRLIIETPDIAKTFEVFLRGDETAKEAALGWVYGGETKGMGHRYCFPRELLAALLEAAGFEILNIRYFDFQPNRPALRFEAVKKECKEADLSAALRKRLLAANIPCFEDEIIISGQEKVIKSLLQAENPDEALYQAVYSAEISAQYFGLKPFGDAMARHESVCARLLEHNLPGRLMAELEKKAVNGVFGPEAFDQVLKSGLEYLKCLVSGKAAAAAPFRAEASGVKLFSRAAAGDFCLKKILSEKVRF